MPKPFKPDSQADIETYLISLLAKACALPAEDIPAQTPLIELGIDSLIAATMNTQIEETLGVSLPLAEIAEGASVEALAEHIAGQLQSDQPVVKEADAVPEVLFHSLEAISESFYDINSLPQYKSISMQQALFKRADVESPYYRSFKSSSTDTIAYQQTTLINFASYNYLGFNDDAAVNEAAISAIRQYGTSAASSRIVSGEKDLHQELEAQLARLYDVEAALVFVSGYATNVGVISHLMHEGDLIIHDSLAHNSIVTGSVFSKARRLAFPHNNMQALARLLQEHRLYYERVLIVVEGLYSMDGDIAPLDELIALKKQYKCLLMVDEAHSIGVLGRHGLGAREHYGIRASDVDLWMGTLSKTFASCGGYIAGCQALIDYLKYSAPAFIFSVGIAPPLAAASLRAIELLQQDNHRVQTLQENSQYFLQQAKAHGFDTGFAAGYAIIPVILGHTLNTAKLANTLFHRGINVQPIIYPGVEEHAARLRFFISAIHTHTQIDAAIAALATAMCSDLRVCS